MFVLQHYTVMTISTLHACVCYLMHHVLGPALLICFWNVSITLTPHPIAGVVSFSRLGALDDLSIDLTEQLRAARQRNKQGSESVASAGPAPSPAATSSSQGSSPTQQRPQRQPRAAASPSYQYKDLPTKNEARRWVDSSLLVLWSSRLLRAQETTRPASNRRLRRFGCLQANTY